MIMYIDLNSYLHIILFESVGYHALTNIKIISNFFIAFLFTSKNYNSTSIY